MLQNEQVTGGICFNYTIHNKLKSGGDVNYDNYLIQNTRLQEINQVHKENVKIIFQSIHCGIECWILGTTPLIFGNNTMFDSIANAVTHTVRRLKLVWRSVHVS